MVFIAETCCCRLITSKFAHRLDLYLFYLLENRYIYEIDVLSLSVSVSVSMSVSLRKIA